MRVIRTWRAVSQVRLRASDAHMMLIMHRYAEYNASEAPGNNSGIDMDEMRTKMDSFKNWTLSTYKTTKQAVRFT